MKRQSKYLIIPTMLLLSGACVAAMEVDKTATIKDTSTSILGVNHVGISVADLDTMLNFYQTATNFKLVKRETISNSVAADTLYGRENVHLEVATLRAPNMLLELVEFGHNTGKKGLAKMPFEGPGITHTCYQSPSAEPSYDKFKQVGIDMLSRGDSPVDIGGYGVTYAYGYDPEGNMLEMEQLDAAVLKRAGYDSTYKLQGEAMWMTQVAFATPDIERLMGFYQKVLQIKPYRRGEYKDNPKLDDISDHDGLHLLGGWFKMGQAGKVMEFWQFVEPQTPQSTSKHVTDLGYRFSLEVSDIQKEYQRLSKEGVTFFSEPQLLGDFWQVYANDIDGNVFALRQAVDTH